MTILHELLAKLTILNNQNSRQNVHYEQIALH